MMPASKRGFTLIELMTVVAILSIIAAIAIPILFETRTRAQIQSTKGVLRTIASGQQAHFSVYGEYTDLQDLAAKDYLDSRFAVVPVELFAYSIDCVVTGAGQGFTATAIPSQPGAPTLTIDETFVISES